MRITFLALAALLASTTSHAQQISPEEQRLGLQLLQAYEALNPSQRAFAENAELDWLHHVRYMRPDGSRMLRSDPQAMDIIKIGLNCDLMVISDIRHEPVWSAHPNAYAFILAAGGDKLRCVKQSLSRDPNIRGYHVDLER